MRVERGTNRKARLRDTRGEFKRRMGEREGGREGKRVEGGERGVHGARRIKNME